jgi:hypothetical protein
MQERAPAAQDGQARDRLAGGKVTVTRKPPSVSERPNPMVAPHEDATLRAVVRPWSSVDSSRRTPRCAIFAFSCRHPF